MSALKIAHIGIYPPRGEKHAKTGGVASYTKNLVTNIPGNDPAHTYVICDKINGAFEEYDEDSVHVIRSFDRSPRFAWQLLKILSRIRPEVIHFQQELYLYGGILTAYILQWVVLITRFYSRVVITLHGVVDLRDVDAKFVRSNNSSLPASIVRGAFRTIYIPLCLIASRIIVHEEKFKNILVDQYFADAGKVFVIPHGVENLQRIPTDSARVNIAVPYGAHVVLFMGYLTGYKGLDTLIEGFAEYAKRDRNAFLIIGAGKHPKLHHDAAYLNEYSRISEKASVLISSEQYVWHGFIDEHDIVKYFSAADVSIYPYTNQMSSSGPLAISIGFNTPFLVSEAFRGVFPDKFVFGSTASDLCDALCNFFTKDHPALSSEFMKIRQPSLWNQVSRAHLKIYV